MLDVQGMINELLEKAKGGQLTEEQAQAAIEKLLEEVSAGSASQNIENSPAVERVKSAAKKARNLA